ncbi:MAG: DNA-3-methyladenine glycosylase [Bacteroidetes bacterium]|nr:DNA-3-methyladenine glycosylase [Bacteroidota bacterium]
MPDIADKYKLHENFYLQDTLTVSAALLGKILVRKTGRHVLSGKIVETEAYLGDSDPACHAYGRVTPRNHTLYMKGGIAYVYFIYGNYYCFNVVTERKGVGAAVLIRAVEPFTGVEQMKLRRPKIRTEHDLTNGPAKLCLSFGIDRKLNEADLQSDEIYISKGNKEKFTIAVSRRIGIEKGAHFPYRFFIKDNPYVTRHKLNKEIISEMKS